MADQESGQKSYPYLSANVWNELRLRFQKSVPAKVTPSYLQSALGFSTEKAARNLIPQLRTVGLIDAEGVPTDLAKSYRLDAEYLEAAKSIVANVYPGELRDLYPGPTENVSSVSNWFMRDTGGGQASAGMQARFYLSLVSGELPAVDRAPKGSTSDNPQVRTSEPRKPIVRASKQNRGPEGDASNSQGNPDRAATGSNKPNLHLDVQIHIAADASIEQVDAVFASLAKHLYGAQ